MERTGFLTGFLTCNIAESYSFKRRDIILPEAGQSEFRFFGRRASIGLATLELVPGPVNTESVSTADTARGNIGNLTNQEAILCLIVAERLVTRQLAKSH